MQEDIAIDRANSLLKHIIEHQPNMIPALGQNTVNGNNVAAFITALRTGLIDMYKKDPG